MPQVSFIILAYNSEKWIEQALISVIKQTYEDLQILLIDDGSTDNTLEKISSFQDPRIEVYKKKHTGIASSLNYALNKVKGEYVARLGADDCCSEERVSKQIDFFRDNKPYGILGSNFFLRDEVNNKITKIRNPEKHEDIVSQLPRRCCIWDGSILIRKIIIDQLNGYCEKWSTGEDWDFFLRAIGLTKFYNLQEYLSTKRYHKESISFSEKAAGETEEILLNYNNAVIRNGSLKETGHASFNLGYHFYYKDDFAKAAGYFRKSLSTGFKLHFFRYYIFSRYLGIFIRIFRKYKIYKMFGWLRYFDPGNKYLRNKF